MKKRLLSLLLLAAALCPSISAQLARIGSDEYITARQADNKAPVRIREKAQGLPVTSVRLRKHSPRKALGTFKGSFEGLLNYPTTSCGWYKFNQQGMKTPVWTPQNAIPVTAGFVADGIVYSFWTQSTTSGGVEAFGLNTYRQGDGAPISTVSYDVFDGYHRMVKAAAYNADEGVAYLICGTKSSAAGYSMQKFNPATGSFTEVASLPASTDYPMALAWHPRNGGIYMLGEYGSLWRFNDETGRFRSIGDTGLTLDDEYGYPGAMTYSPLDEKFVALIETDTYTSFYAIDPLKGTASTLASLGDDSQWRILYCSDTTADPSAPAAPANVKASFTDGKTQGTISAVLPSVSVAGNPLSGQITLRISEGKNLISDAVKGEPGQAVTATITLTEGFHNLSVAASTTSGQKQLTGPATSVTVFAGYDSPAAPENVVLSADKVSWTAPKGISGGTVDLAAIKYNVYIDDKAVTQSPVSGTELAVTLPSFGPVAHVARVEAVYNGIAGPSAFSAPLTGRAPFGLPCSIAPVAGQTNLSTEVQNLFSVLNVNRDNREWIYDEQKEQTGGFYYLASGDNDADDWLVLPQMTFAAPGLYRLSMEVSAGYQSYWSEEETFEIGFGPEAYAPSLKIISEPVVLKPKNNFEPYELIFRVEQAGNYHVGIHCITEKGHYRLYARNFLVERAGGSVIPAAATNLTATADPRGALEITASFTMPTIDNEGKPLDNATALTATVTCDNNSTTVNGTPGQTVTARIDAVQGVNTVSVRVAGPDGEQGPATSVELFAGVSIPSVANISKSISADNNTLTLKWTLPETSEDGGFVDPATCEYTIMRRNSSGNWIVFDNAGKGASTWSFTVEAGSPQDIYAFGVLPSNAAGAAPSFAYADAMLGALNSLPMKEVYRSSGDNIINLYDPIQIQNIAEQYCSWAFVDPAEIDGGEPNQTSTAIMAYYQGYGQITLPRFSTVGADNITITLSLLCSPLSSTEVTVAVATPDTPFLAIETLDLTQAQGWQKFVVSVPQAALGKGWAGLTIRCLNPTQFHHFVMDAYTIEVFNGKGLNVENVTAPAKLRLNRPATISATLANYSTEALALPALKAELIAENGSTAALQPVEAYDDVLIGRGEKLTVQYTLTPMPEHLGYGKVRVAIADPALVDRNPAAEARINIVKGYTPAITDLAATTAQGELTLGWSALELPENVTEGAEDLVLWERGETLGDFRNIDYDLQPTYNIGEFAYPGKYEPKAFEVFAGSEFTGVESVGDLLQAFDGDRYFIAFSPDSRAVMPADDWLISPRIAPGSQLSFYILAPSNTYGEESLEVLVSKTHDDSSAFEHLQTFTTADLKWIECKVTLPADARYFALRYTGLDKFCLMLDNIKFTPYECNGTVAEYDVYAGGKLIGTTQSTEFKVENAPNKESYYVVPRVKAADGSTIEALRSNIIVVDLSGIATPDASNIVVKAARGGVHITGADSLTADIVTPDGRIVARAELTDDTFISLPAGIYIVRVAGVAAKVAVD